MVEVPVKLANWFLVVKKIATRLCLCCAESEHFPSPKIWLLFWTYTHILFDLLKAVHNCMSLFVKKLLLFFSLPFVTAINLLNYWLAICFPCFTVEQQDLTNWKYGLENIFKLVAAIPKCSLRILHVYTECNTWKC